MTIEDLKGVKLSPATRGYLSIYIKLTDLYEDAYDASRMEFGDNEACLLYTSDAADEL